MDYYMNRRRTECGRSQIFSVPSEVPVNVQCCCPPPDLSRTAPSGSQPVFMPDTSMNSALMPDTSMNQPALMPDTSMSQPTLMPNTSMNRPSAAQSRSGSDSQTNHTTNTRYFPTGSLACPGSLASHVEHYPIGMGYVPMQQWNRTYSLAEGFRRGTIFPDLDLPFVMGRCQ